MKEEEPDIISKNWGNETVVRGIWYDCLLDWDVHVSTSLPGARGGATVNVLCSCVMRAPGGSEEHPLWARWLQMAVSSSGTMCRAALEGHLKQAALRAPSWMSFLRNARGQLAYRGPQWPCYLVPFCCFTPACCCNPKNAKRFVH